MWYKREIIRNYGEQKVVAIVKADNLKEAQDGFDEWISKDENRIAVDNAFKNKLFPGNYHDGKWFNEGLDKLPHYLDYDFVIKNKIEPKFVDVIIDYSEDSNIPLAIRSKRYYFKKTSTEVLNILSLWSIDFIVDYDTTIHEDPQYKKYETLIYKAKLREKKNK